MGPISSAHADSAVPSRRHHRRRRARCQMRSRLTSPSGPERVDARLAPDRRVGPVPRVHERLGGQRRELLGDRPRESARASPPGKSVRPTRPANSVSPENRCGAAPAGSRRVQADAARRVAGRVQDRERHRARRDRVAVVRAGGRRAARRGRIRTAPRPCRRCLGDAAVSVLGVDQQRRAGGGDELGHGRRGGRSGRA